MVYLVSDPHFFHENIIKYTQRPFKNIKEFEKYYIEMHNSIVNEEDLVIFLGDMMWGRNSSLRKLKNLLKKLKGKKWLIKGNHDIFSDLEYYKIGFDLVRDYLIINDSILCHYQLTDNEYTTKDERKLLHLVKKYDKIYHGHIHNRDSNIEDGKIRINCCIDYYKNNFKLIPVNFDILDI